ncbi:MAG: hypothetical protein ACTSP3_07460 [Candidatus Heimdallarchaeaceae archaeon]
MTEKESLNDFIEIAEKYNKRIFTGQLLKNRLTIEGNLYYQFGDLRIEMNDFTILVETEGAGGVSNIVKYWYCFENKIIEKPIVLLHLYQQSSINDYGSHLLLWKFIWEKMQKEINKKKNLIVAYLFPCFDKKEIERAKNLFEGYLTGKQLYPND